MSVRVAFDSQIFAAQRFGGISRYFVQLVEHLVVQAGVRAKVFAPFYLNEYLDTLAAEHRFGRRLSVAPRVAQIANLAATPVAFTGFRSWRPDIIHWTYYYPQLDMRPKARKVLTVYDMIHELRPEDFNDGGAIARWKARAVRRADHVICISESTRRDLLARYPVDPARVSVTHLGHAALRSNPAQQDGRAFRAAVFGSDLPYLLHVGSRGGYKNFAGLLRAYASSRWLRSQFALLCFGAGPFTEEERAMIGAFGLEKGVRWIGGADDLLAAAYRHAALFVYPSMYEGFGIPPLEAMSLDCPVACGNTSSLPEVVGDAAAFFDPASSESMAHTIESTLSNAEALAALVTRGRGRVSRFTWGACASRTREIYEQVMS